jgi:hypothetical protein
MEVYNMSKNVDAILARFTERLEIQIFVEILKNEGMECSWNFHANTITTPNLFIKCLIIPVGAKQIKYVRGMRYKGCFGLDPEAEDYVARGDNQCKDYDCLLKYIKDSNKEMDVLCNV